MIISVYLFTSTPTQRHQRMKKCLLTVQTRAEESVLKTSDSDSLIFGVSDSSCDAQALYDFFSRVALLKLRILLLTPLQQNQIPSDSNFTALTLTPQHWCQHSEHINEIFIRLKVFSTLVTIYFDH